MVSPGGGFRHLCSTGTGFNETLSLPHVGLSQEGWVTSGRSAAEWERSGREEFVDGTRSEVDFQVSGVVTEAVGLSTSALPMRRPKVTI